MVRDKDWYEKKYGPTLEQAQVRFAEQREIFDLILQIGYAVDKTIVGRDAPSAAAYQGAIIFTKALAHTISLGKIIPVVGLPQQLYDISSSAVIVRAIAESYIAFRYNAIEPASEDDANFRSALTQYHSKAKQLNIMKRFGISDERLTDAGDQLDVARVVLENDVQFLLQTEAVRKQQLEGKVSMHRTLEDIAEIAGIHRDIWGTAYVYLSQFAHTSPFSVRFAHNFRADSPSGPSSLSMLLQWASGFLAKFISDMETIIPGCTATLTPEQLQLLAVEVAVIEGISPGQENG